MGCSHKTAKQWNQQCRHHRNSLIQIHNNTSLNYIKSIKKCYIANEQQILDNNSQNNSHKPILKKDSDNIIYEIYKKPNKLCKTNHNLINNKLNILNKSINNNKCQENTYQDSAIIFEKNIVDKNYQLYAADIDCNICKLNSAKTINTAKNSNCCCHYNKLNDNNSNNINKEKKNNQTNNNKYNINTTTLRHEQHRESSYTTDYMSTTTVTCNVATSSSSSSSSSKLLQAKTQLHHKYNSSNIINNNSKIINSNNSNKHNTNLHEILLYARKLLTTHLVSVSNCLIEPLNRSIENELTTTTATNATKEFHYNHNKHNNYQYNQHQHYQYNKHYHHQQNVNNCCQTQIQQSEQQQHQQQKKCTRDTSASNCNTKITTTINDNANATTTVNTNASNDATINSATTTTNAATTTYNNGYNYYYLLRNPISFYAASSMILVLCYLTTTTTATPAKTENAGLEKHPIFDESSSDKEILDLLLEKKRYDKRLLPPVNDEDFCCGLSSPDMAKNQNARRPHNRGTLTVNVNVLLLSLASPDESSLKYEVEFLLNQQWNDPRLQYGNKSQYDFLNALHHHDSIWTPDTYFIMHGDFKDPIIPMHFALRIYRNGTITYAMRRHLILSCQGSLHIFPFDDPKCSFSMESISYEEPQIKYVWKNDEDTLRKSPSLTTLNAYLIKNQTTACDQNSWRGNYSCLQVELTFTRDRAYYFTTVFIPGIILVTSSFITFWLEWNAVPARVMIGVTTMLNFFTTSNGFRSTLPVVSNLTAMNVWDGVCMCFIYASLLEFVCVNYVGRKRPLHNVVYRPGENPVTQRLPAVLSRIGVILASPLGEKRRDAGAPNEIVACTTCGSSSSPCTHSANNGCATETCFVQVRKKEPPHPIRVAKTIDVIARITFPTAYAIFLIFFFVHYKGFS